MLKVAISWRQIRIVLPDRGLKGRRVASQLGRTRPYAALQSVQTSWSAHSWGPKWCDGKWFGFPGYYSALVISKHENWQ